MEKFNQFLKKELNQTQLKAVTSNDGSTIVIAGAGSGKTRVITARIANLIINQKADPTSIIALTFTNKAANEMKNRLISFLQAEHKLPFVGTFHSYCLLLLRSNSKYLAHPDFTILDSDDQISLIKKILKKNGLEKQFGASEINYQISNLKNKLQPDLEKDLFSNQLFKEIYLQYEAEKSASHCLDFDDLILEVLKIFREQKTFRLSFQEKIQHILVDEYQDTNMVQHEMLKYMSLNSKLKFTLGSICVVGDEDQSIYSWRGAMPANMLQFKKDFSPVTEVKIEQNYRSVQPILDAANNVITNNRTRSNKTLWSEKKAKNRILHVRCKSGYQESLAITNFISCLPEDKKLSEVAILYRTHFQSRNIEEALMRNSIPYKIIGGIRFYERKEIKDLLAYLRLIVNPFDRASLFRAINCPTRGLGAKFEELLYIQWNQNPLFDFKQLFKHILDSPEVPLPYAKTQSVRKFLDIFKNLKDEKKPTIIIEQIIEEIEYLQFLQKSYDTREAETKIENVKEFVQSIHNFEKTSNENSLDIFLQEITLMQEKTENKENAENEIQCMTLHAAKGLEFDTIIITGLEEGLLPSSRSLSSLKALEEERRLFYVGVTRAKERLLLMHAEYRNSFGQINEQVISRFLEEIPEKLLQSIDITEMNASQCTNAFSKWLGSKKNASSLLTFQDFSQNSKPIIKPKSNETRKINTLPAKTPPPPKESPVWKKNQIVLHKKFGPGIIKKVEQKNNSEYYITAKFKIGEKKILSNFLQIS